MWMLLFHAGDLQSISEAEVDWWHAACREAPNPQASRPPFCSARCGRSGAALAPCIGAQSPRRGVFSHVLFKKHRGGRPDHCPRELRTVSSMTPQGAPSGDDRFCAHKLPPEVPACCPHPRSGRAPRTSLLLCLFGPAGGATIRGCPETSTLGAVSSARGGPPGGV